MVFSVAPGGLAGLHPGRRAQGVQAGEEPLGSGAGREQLWRGTNLKRVGTVGVRPLLVSSRSFVVVCCCLLRRHKPEQESRELAARRRCFGKLRSKAALSLFAVQRSPFALCALAPYVHRSRPLLILSSPAISPHRRHRRLTPTPPGRPFLRGGGHHHAGRHHRGDPGRRDRGRNRRLRRRPEPGTVRKLTSTYPQRTPNHYVL